jgi:hypothetical protein
MGRGPVLHAEHFQAKNWDFSPLNPCGGGNLYMGAKLGLPKYVGPPANPTVYSVVFEMELNPSQFGQRQERHFQIANEALEVARAADPKLAAYVPAPAGWGRPPPGWTWQHATMDQGARWSNGQLVRRAGVMQLVPRYQHTPGSVWRRLFHPLPYGGGGYMEWARPAGAPRRN